MPEQEVSTSSSVFPCGKELSSALPPWEFQSTQLRHLLIHFPHWLTRAEHIPFQAVLSLLVPAVSSEDERTEPVARACIELVLEFHPEKQQEQSYQFSPYTPTHPPPSQHCAAPETCRSWPNWQPGSEPRTSLALSLTFEMWLHWSCGKDLSRAHSTQ